MIEKRCNGKEIIIDYLRCENKAFLKLNDKYGIKSEYEELDNDFAESYKINVYKNFIFKNFQNKKIISSILYVNLDYGTYDIATDVTINNNGLSINFDALIYNYDSSNKHNFIPILFIHREKIFANDKLLLAVLGLILGNKTKIIPNFGRIIHGENFTVKKIYIDKLITKADTILQNITSLKNSEEPPTYYLNEHCKFCEFQNECYKTAFLKDDLSLLSGLRKKDILKLNKKGLFTVTQYSYTFRPRRKRKKINCYNNPHRTELKALAIRENQVYVYEMPILPQAKTEIYLDVEGIPDKNYYYLIGLLIISKNNHIEYSLWANNPQEQFKNFNNFLKIIQKYKDYTIYHFGNYDRVFLKKMIKSYGEKINWNVESILGKCCNLLTYYNTNIYLPTYTNSLKDIAKYFGFEWKEENPSGIQSIVWRLKWEMTKSKELLNKLKQYNIDDCYALMKAKQFIMAIVCNDKNIMFDNQPFNIAYCKDIKSSSPFKFVIGDYALPEIKSIHQCSFFDYQRQKVFIRSDDYIKKNEEKKKKKKIVLRPNKKLFLYAQKCVRCKTKNIKKILSVSKLIIDLKIRESGVKRWIVQINSHTYKCENCNALFTPKRFKTGGERYIPKGYKSRSKYGHNLISWVIFQNIVNKQSFRQIEYNLFELFNLSINKSTLHGFKIYIQKFYESTYHRVINKILESKVIYVDETPLKMKDEDGYAWVFTNNKEVISVYQKTREGEFLKDFLKDFHDVLVSDFYAAYDSIACLHQKCLIHLIRDMNDDLLKNPFDGEFKFIAQLFTVLLKNIVKTIDKYGLSARHLNKHKKEFSIFFRKIETKNFSSEIAIHYQNRLIKNKDKLFEFLNHDNVSWNNNNAEHAIKLLATHTNRQIKFFSAAQIAEYLKIMSIYQTCVYNNVSFLKFLISKEKNLDKYLLY